MQKLILAITLLAAVSAFSFRHEADSIISTVNSNPESTWVAGHNEYFDGMSKIQMQNLLGALPEDLSDLEEQYIAIDAEIPTEFNSAEKWSNCGSVSQIRDQSHCGSCWAVSSANVMSDRICIQSNGQDQTRISSDDILSCCGIRCGMGCNGGFPSQAFKFYQRKGVVTGGLYNQNQFCKSYPFPPCEHHVPSGPYVQCDDLPEYKTPKCQKQCNSEFTSTYNSDKHFGKHPYKVSSNVEQIQLELMTNGPIVAGMDVYADFYTYKSGVYQHLTGENLGGHAIKLVGWGVENGVEYWLLANQWNETWGEDGYFKILRGTDECGIESSLVAGQPDLQRHNSQATISE